MRQGLLRIGLYCSWGVCCTLGEVYEEQRTESILLQYFFGHCFSSETFSPKNANMFTSDICRVTSDLSLIQGHISGTRHHLWVEDSHCHDNAICQLYLQPITMSSFRKNAYAEFLSYHGG